MTARILEGDCREVMATLAAESISAIVTDPPYGLSFMGAGWDHGVPGAPYWREAFRVLKPGAHLLAFGGTRTYHRLAVAIEDAGFDIRDCLSWLYGSGFPKSLDVSKAIDKQAGAEREVIGEVRRWGGNAGNGRGNQYANGYEPSEPGAESFGQITAPSTAAAQQWDGWGTALKPAWEPVIVARKPFAGTVAATVQAHGTGGMNIDGCRLPYVNEAPPDLEHWRKTSGGWKNTSTAGVVPNDNSKGRWPANVALDEAMAAMLDAQSGERDTGGPSRFFYTAKASTAERGKGLAGTRNAHPTVKPLALMQWLCRLVTPPGGLVLDPFCGSGTTGVAADREGFDFVGIELSPEYADLARRRFTGDAPLFATLVAEGNE